MSVQPKRWEKILYAYCTSVTFGGHISSANIVVNCVSCFASSQETTDVLLTSAPVVRSTQTKCPQEVPRKATDLNVMNTRDKTVAHVVDATEEVGYIVVSAYLNSCVVHQRAEVGLSGLLEE